MSRLDLNSNIHHAQPIKQSGDTSSVQTAQSTDTGTSSIFGSRQLDQTKLSSTSGLVAQGIAGSDVRTAKVAALQQAIASGTYNVSASAVADKIISSLMKQS